MNIFWGLLLVALGITILWTQLFTTLASTFFLGWVLVVAGVAQFFYGVTSGNWRQTLLFIITGAISLFIGLVAISNPALSAITFTLLIGILLIVSGTYRLISTIITREENWGYALTGGIVSLLLGISIVLSWPSSGLFIIGLFIGVELLINGILLMTSPEIMWEEEEEYQYPISSNIAGAKGGKAGTKGGKADKEKSQKAKTNTNRDKKERKLEKEHDDI